MMNLEPQNNEVKPPLPSIQPIYLEKPEKKTNKLLIVLIIFLIGIIALGIVYILMNYKNTPAVQNTISHTTDTTTSQTTSNTQSEQNNQIEEEPVIENKVFSFIVPSKFLRRPAGGDTEFAMMAPSDAVLTNTELAPDSVLYNYTLKGSNFEVNISRPVEVYPTKYDNTLVGVSVVNKIGPVWRLNLAENSYTYTSDVKTDSTCESNNGTVQPPCGSPILSVTDEDLQTSFFFNCKGNANSCDAILSTLDIHAVAGSACGGGAGCI